MTVVGFFAHPDDESYSAGGLFAALAEHGVAVQIICATRGEGGMDLRARRRTQDPIELGATRSEELRAACRALGLPPPRFLGQRDGAVSSDGCLAQLKPHLDELAPRVIVTLGRDGAYGHPDHLACTDAVSRAVAATETRVLHCVFPRGLFAPLHQKLSLASFALGVPEADLGVAREDVDAAFAVGHHAERKRHAIAAHQSQLPDADEPLSFLMPGLVGPLLEEEWYQLAAGPPLQHPHLLNAIAAA